MPQTDPFHGGGEVRALARSLDWGSTPLGSVQGWSGTLAGAVRTCLDSPFPICLWCGPELVLIYNDAYRRVLGAKHPAALGRPGPDVWSEIWTDISPLFERIRHGGPSSYEEDAPFHVRRAPADEANGAPRGPNAWFTFSLSPVRDDAGGLVAFLNIVSETTRRIHAEQARERALAEAERAESRLREVFVQAPSFLAVLRGREHVFEYVNEAYYTLVGHRDLIGRPLFEALPDVRDQGFEELLDGVLATGEPFIGREVPARIRRTPDSPPEERFLDLVYYPITEADGTRSGVVAHGSDVTEHVLARREAQQARVEAERANRAKSQFLATMSHEIRTPLNAVLGFADLLDAGISGALSEAQAKYVAGIRASGRHLLGLISDVLDFATIEAGEMMVGVEELEARAVVASALQIVAPQAEAKGLQLEERWECTGGVQVRGDEDRIRQILLNLLANSLKFTEAGGTISLGCRSEERAPSDTALPDLGPWVVIEVEDTGRGVPEEELVRVFDPFVQAEPDHTRKPGGTGLGLTISRRLARLMGGELTVRSELGVGSSFCLWLPAWVQGRVPSLEREPPPSEAWPPPPRELPGLAAVGQTLLGWVEPIEAEFVERLEADHDLRTTDRLNRAQLADQTAELVTATAKVLVALEEGGGDPVLRDDAEAIQSLVATRHGQQRRRLGFGRGEVEREYRILGEVLDRTLRREAPKRTAANLGTALSVVRRLMKRARATSLSVYDGSAEAEGRG